MSVSLIQKYMGTLSIFCFSSSRQKLRQVFSDSDKHHLLQSEKRTKEDLRLDSKVSSTVQCGSL